MANGGPHQPGRPRARAATRPGVASQPQRGLTRIDPHPSIPPALRQLFEQCLVAGPVFGVLSALYGYQLVQHASPILNPATHETLRQIQSWHGHFLRAYYITPAQNAVWWALSAPALAWLIMLVVIVAALGIRANRAD